MTWIGSLFFLRMMTHIHSFSSSGDELLEDGREEGELQVTHQTERGPKGAELVAHSTGSKNDAPCRKAQEKEGPKRHQTRSNRMTQENKPCSSGHSPAKIPCRTYAPAPDPHVHPAAPRSPDPGNGEDSVEESIICSRDEEDLASCSTRDSEREARKSHATQFLVPTELGPAIPPETFDQGLEYAVPLEGPDWQEDMDRARREPGTHTRLIRTATPLKRRGGVVKRKEMVYCSGRGWQKPWGRAL